DLDKSVDEARAFRQRFGIALDKELVVQVSWIIPEKGIPDVLETARLVLAKRPNAHFVLAGNGNYTGEDQRAAAQMGMDRSGTWWGLLENPMREGVYAAADVFCLLSRWEEAFGWVIAEAMSFERPVVATAVGGIPEVVADGVTGLLGPRNDPATAAQHMLQLLEDAELRRKRGVAGRRRVEEMFELRSGVRELVRHYGI